MVMVMMVTAVRGVGAARMRNRIASYCIWGGSEANVHKLGHEGHLYLYLKLPRMLRKLTET